MIRIAIDMDDVIADTSASLLALYNVEFEESITMDQLSGTHLLEFAPGERRARVQSYLFDADFFDGLPVIRESVRVIQALNERYEVFFATAAMHYPECFGARYQWLRTHFSFIPPRRIVFCGDKSILKADYLIDDNPWQLERFHGHGILFSAPHNAGITGFRRVHNWLEIQALFGPQETIEAPATS